MLHLQGRKRKHSVLENVFNWMAMSSCPKMRDIIVVRAFILQRLPMELVDLILDIAGYWPHTTTILEEPVRAFGPFTWRWNGGIIDYFKQWCPSGPAYGHRWSRWGESRLQNSFIFRSPRLGVYASRLDAYRGVIPGRAYSLLIHLRGRCNISRTWKPPRGVRSARKIVFEISCHQDHFGAWSHDCSNEVRLFCDIGINRRSVARVTSPKQWQKSPSGSKARPKIPEQGPLVTYKPLIVERWCTLRHSRSKTYLMTWSYDDDQPNELSEEGFPTAKEFVKQLEVGDSIGVWARVGEGESYHIIDGMRMHIFWAV